MGASLKAQLGHLEGPRPTLDPGAWPAPRAPGGGLWAGQGARGGAQRCPEGPRGGAPYILRLVPWCCPSRANTPGTPEHMRVCTCAHTHAHTHTHDVVCPSVHPFQVLGPGRQDPVITACQRQHGGLGSVLTLMGARPAGRSPSRPRAPAAGWGRGQQVVSEHGVVPRGARAGGVLAAWRVLLEGHR